MPSDVYYGVIDRTLQNPLGLPERFTLVTLNYVIQGADVHANRAAAQAQAHSLAVSTGSNFQDCGIHGWPLVENMDGINKILVCPRCGSADWYQTMEYREVVGTVITLDTIRCNVCGDTDVDILS